MGVRTALVAMLGGRQTAAWLAVVSLLVGGHTASAQQLYGVNSTDDSLSLIDAATGAVTILGPLGGTYQSPVGVAVERSTGAIFAVDSGFVGGQRLVTLDPATGSVTSTFPLAEMVRAIAFDTPGTLYGVTGSELVTLSTTTVAPLDLAVSAMADQNQGLESRRPSGLE